MTSRLFLLAATAASVTAAVPPEPKFQPITIDDKVQIGYGVAVADVDGDKAPDIVLADKKQFVWYRNPGAAKAADPASWQKYIIAENLTEKDNVCLAAQDIDGDGKCELAVGAEWNPGDTEKSGAVFYLIPPADRTQRWEPVKFPSVEPTTHRMKWIKLEDGTWGLVVVPLHGRGNKNGEGAPVKVLVYRKPAEPHSEWKSETIETGMHMTHNFAILNSGRVLMVAGKEGTAQFTRDQSGNWKRQSAASTDPAGEVRVSVGGNLICTVEPMHGNQLVAYPESKKRIVLTDQLVEGHALAFDDVLGVGSSTVAPEIIVGWRGNPEKPRPVGIKLYTALDATGEIWRESLIDDNGMACEDLVLADLNADGKLDIVASGRSTKNLKLYLNETPPTP
jgi:FG-GAP-like repeat